MKARARIQIPETELIKQVIDAFSLIALTHLTQHYLKEVRRLVELCYTS